MVTLGLAPLTWSGFDAGSSVLDHDVRSRRATWNGGFSGYTQPASWQHLTAGTLKVPTAAGSLSPSTGWSRATSSACYAATITGTSRAGVTLTRTGVRARRIFVVATKRRGCGSIGVYGNGKLLRSYILNASSTCRSRSSASSTSGASSPARW